MMKYIKKVSLLTFIFLIVLLGACKKTEENYTLPNINDLNQTQITQKFNELGIADTLSFEYQYVEALNHDVFVKYKTFGAGQSIKQTDTVIVVMSSKTFTLPNLEGKNQTEIIDAFAQMGIPESKLVFKVNSMSTIENGLFISYLNTSAGRVFDFTDAQLTITVKRNPTLPDLTNLNTAEIQAKFSELNMYLTLDFLKYYQKNQVEDKFVKYVRHEVDQSVNNGDVVSIYMSSNTINLPNLAGQTRDEIVETFANIGVDRNLISFIPEINLTIKSDAFIAYDGYRIGDSFDFSSRIRIFYNMTSTVPDLEGQNKYQIAETLKQTNILNYVFLYEYDNSKEYDLFKSYEDVLVGSQFDPSETIYVVLYANDNVNTQTQKPVDTQLFISKYVDGGNFNLAIELYNPTSSTIDLSQYYLAILINGAYVPTHQINFTGVLEPQQTFLIVHSSADEALRLKADLLTENLLFDGNDTIQLRFVDNHTFLDTIYHVGNISSTMDGEIFVRRDYITAGNRYFVQNDWVGFIPTFTDILKTHPTSESAGPNFVHISDKTFQQYGMTEVELLSVADGDTIYVNSVDPRDTTSYSGNSRLRFLLVDTPETTKPGVEGQPYANLATHFTRTLLEAATTIYIQSDPSSGLKETYGRHLALIWFYIENPISFQNIKQGSSITVEAGWHLLNYELLKYGLGEKNSGKTVGFENAPIFGNRYLYQWAESALLHAIENKYGLYSGVHVN